MSLLVDSSSIPTALDPTVVGAVSHGLHQTAQPLTVLLGLLELASLAPHTVEEYGGIIQRAAEQSRRLSDCFNHLRELFCLPALASDVAGKGPETTDTPESERMECAHV